MTRDPQLLADLIHRKHRCLVQLRDLGERQLALVRAGTMTDLLDVLAVKQRMLAQLERIEGELAPFRGEDPEKRAWRSEEARRRCAEELAGCEAVLAQIVEQEKQSERELVFRRDQAARQLQGTHVAQRAREAYLAPQAGANRLDLSSS